MVFLSPGKCYVFYLNRTNFRADLILRGQKNRISRGFNFAKLVFSKISRGFNFANAVLKQIFTKLFNIIKTVTERIKMIYCQSPVGKIAKNTHWRSVFLTRRHRILSAN